MSGKEVELVKDAFNSNWIAPIGPDIEGFEKGMAQYLNMNSACATSSGTAALHLALRILDIDKGDIVICPSLTFVASANVILYENAIPVFVDVDPKYWTIDLISLEDAIKKFAIANGIDTDGLLKSAEQIQQEQQQAQQQ